jgi:hypothetical protein
MGTPMLDMQMNTNDTPRPVLASGIFWLLAWASMLGTIMSVVMLFEVLRCLDRIGEFQKAVVAPMHQEMLSHLKRMDAGK